MMDTHKLNPWKKTSAQKDGLSQKDAGEMGIHREFHDISTPACSSDDCTGLIPAPPQSDAEQESYEELYPYLPPLSAKADPDSSWQ